MKRLLGPLTVSAILLSGAAQAATVSSTTPVSPTTPFGLKGSFDAGYDAASGNSDTAALNAKGELKRDWRDWALIGDAEAHYAESSGVKNTENEQVNLQGNRKLPQLGHEDFIFAKLDYTRDTFSGYDYQIGETVGYGRKLYQGKKQTLTGQAGIGVRESQTVSDSSRVDPVIEPQLDYTYAFNKRFSFTETAKGTLGTDYSVVQSESGLKSDISKDFFLKASYTLRYTSDVPGGRKNTDTFTGVSLGYKL